MGKRGRKWYGSKNEVDNGWQVNRRQARMYIKVGAKKKGQTTGRKGSTKEKKQQQETLFAHVLNLNLQKSIYTFIIKLHFLQKLPIAIVYCVLRYTSI